MKRIWLIINILLFTSVLNAQDMVRKIPNDSCKIWTELNHYWEGDDIERYSSLNVLGITNNYEFPGWIREKKRKIWHFNEKARIIILKKGIYISSKFITHTARLFLFCTGDSITIVPDYMYLTEILEKFIGFCKDEKYSDNQIKEYLNKIIPLTKE